ncbi:hypothetical protein [Algibacter mikhailovii]|nr:hypothetical protein [Algibacter mikhailovii]
MIPRSIKKPCLPLILVLLFFSCVKEVDFDQANDLELTPVMSSSLVFFDESASSFVESGSEIDIIQEFLIIDLFTDTFIVENLVKAEFVFLGKNALNRDVNLQVDFLDDLDVLVHRFSIEQEAAVEGSEVFTEYIETFEGDTLLALKSTIKIVFTLRLIAEDPIPDDITGRVELQSSSNFYFKIAAAE